MVKLPKKEEEKETNGRDRTKLRILADLFGGKVEGEYHSEGGTSNSFLKFAITIVTITGFFGVILFVVVRILEFMQK